MSIVNLERNDTSRNLPWESPRVRDRQTCMADLLHRLAERWSDLGSLVHTQAPAATFLRTDPDGSSQRSSDASAIRAYLSTSVIYAMNVGYFAQISPHHTPSCPLSSVCRIDPSSGPLSMAYLEYLSRILGWKHVLLTSGPVILPSQGCSFVSDLFIPG